MIATTTTKHLPKYVYQNLEHKREQREYFTYKYSCTHLSFIAEPN